MARHQERSVWYPGVAWAKADVRIEAIEQLRGAELRAGVVRYRIRRSDPALARLRGILAADRVSGTAR